MKEIKELLTSLKTILNLKSKSTLILALQEKIWNDSDNENKELNEILTELAYDLDFYEPNDEWRKKFSGYYGDERLEKIIVSAIYKIENING